MTKKLLFSFCVITTALFCACTNTSENKPTQKPKYAHLFDYRSEGENTYINVYLPQDTTTPYRTYLLYKGEKKKLPIGDTIPVHVPLENIGCAHSTQIGFITALGKQNQIKSIGSVALLEKKSVLNGRKDLGEFFNGWTFDIEKLLTLSSDGIFFSPYGTEDIDAIQKSIKTPILLDMSPWENHPLARSEWIRFVSFFLECTEEADSVFSALEKRYLEQEKIAVNSTEHPVVLSGLPYQGVWYIPSGGSYKGILFSDASLEYPWKDNKETGSLTVDFEQVLSRGVNADVWFIESGLDTCPTKEDMLSQNKLYTHFRSFKTGNIFICDTNEVLYFEEGIMHPDYILEDYIHLSRGDKDYTPHYYQPIKEKK
ncbi:MAG: ABC transporter substrate-binding protein [Flavobacteriales bacterium]|nr:ABC transporter substrate-binding protein [Flavobacteriales bacterium]